MGKAIRELLAAIRDVMECGDLPGHLAAWWRVITRRVAPDDRAWPTISWRGHA